MAYLTKNPTTGYKYQNAYFTENIDSDESFPISLAWIACMLFCRVRPHSECIGLYLESLVGRR